MRVENWNIEKFNKTLVGDIQKRFDNAAEAVARETRRQLNPKKSISRPPYKKGPYKGEPWTARYPGMLKKSIRTVKARQGTFVKGTSGDEGYAFAEFKNVRVYAGHYLAYYVWAYNQLFDPFITRARENTKAEVKRIIENG